MSLTLDILLTNDPSSGTDKTGEWEDAITDSVRIKMKSTLKITDDDSLKELEFDFKEPEVSLPKEKKVIKNEAKTINTTKRRDKKTLF